MFAGCSGHRDNPYLGRKKCQHTMSKAIRNLEPQALWNHFADLNSVPRASKKEEQVIAFMEEMDQAGANWHLHAYSGVRHGFTDPGSDERDLDAVAYDPSADRQSWAAMMSFLDEVLEA